MKERILTFYNNNKRKIWLVLICFVVLIAIPRILGFFFNSNTENKVDTNVINNNEQNNLNTSVIGAQQSVISGEQLHSSQETYIQLIDKFVDLCNNNNIEEAYATLSTDCKEELYPSVESFKNNYYNQIFNGKNKTAVIENWVSNIYKVDYINDMLSAGTYNANENIQDYITVVDDNGETKLNINNYIGKIEINRDINYMNIRTKVTSKKVYMDYEIYTFEIQNNSENSILLGNKDDINNLYIEDENGNKYEAYTHELTESNLIVPAGTVRNINIKYYNKYSSSRVIRKVVFSKVILNNDWYSTLENKATYNYFGVIEIGL